MRYYLKKARKEAGLTQAEIAKKVGIARTSYTNIELGIKNPSFDVATKIKRVLRVNNDDIFLNINVPKGNKNSNYKNSKGSDLMKVAIVKTTISRKKLMTGEFTPDSEEIIGYEEVDEEEFYRPLVQFLYPKIKKFIEEEKNNVD